MKTKRQIFYSFHFDNDVMRVQQIRNIGAFESNQPVSVNDWEAIKKKGDSAIEKWIDENMKYRSCVVVLIGEETANRKWVKYEIKKAWNDGKGLLGIYIHDLKDPHLGKSKKGANPFDQISMRNGISLSSLVKSYNPDPNDAYSSIADNIEKWIEQAIRDRN